jgi:hypothetical protein
MKEPFELEWMGGPAEHHFRKARPGIDDLPWGTLDTSAYPPQVVAAARATWTESAYTEYRAVAAFSEVLGALCETKAPLDLIGMASSFVADEVVHVELCSRVAMELGGGVPRPVDFEALVVRPDRALSPFERANELVLRVSCIAEAFSGRMAVSAMRGTTHPLTRGVYERIVADESLHYRLGGLYFEWASERMEDDERLRLAGVARRTLEALSPMWKRRKAESPRRNASLQQIQEIGWIESRLYAGHVHAAVREAIVAPLASYGIELGREEVEALLAS